MKMGRDFTRKPEILLLSTKADGRGGKKEAAELAASFHCSVVKFTG